MANSKQWGRWTSEQQHFDGGGQAEIHLVVDSRGEYPGRYALKRRKNPKRHERFTREILALRKLNGHPHIVTLVDAEEDEEPSWFVMVLGDGSMEKCAPEGGYPVREAFDLFRQVCDGVAALHDEKVIHRDLKPDNVIMADGIAHVGDLGLCLIEELARITPVWEAVGPRYYMAPEAEAGRDDEADIRMDIYSLGKILYWLLTGKTLHRENLHARDYALPGKREYEAFDEFNPVIGNAIAEQKRNRTKDVASLLAQFEMAVGRFEARPERTLALKREAVGAVASYGELPPLSEAEAASFAEQVLDDRIPLAATEIWPLASVLSQGEAALALRLLERLDEAELAALMPAIAGHFFASKAWVDAFGRALLGWRDRDLRPEIIRYVVSGNDKRRLRRAVSGLGLFKWKERIDLAATLPKLGAPPTWPKSVLLAAAMQDYPGRSADMRAIMEAAGDDADRFFLALEIFAISEKLDAHQFMGEFSAYLKAHENSPRLQEKLRALKWQQDDQEE